MGSIFSCFSSPNTVKEESHRLSSPARPAKPSKSGLSDSDFKDWKMVGEGAYGQVFSATEQQTGELVAVKKILRTEIDRYVRDECLNLAKCSHSQIITYLDAFLSDKHLCVVMEYADGGDLHAYMREKQSLTEKQARWLFQQIICAMDYCHRFEIAHRDLKLENTLMVLKGQMPLIKIFDFGVANFERANLAAMQTRGLRFVGYIAPEVFLGGLDMPNDGAKADIWSAGVILYTMVIGQHPFVTNEDVESGNFSAANKKSLHADYSFPKGAVLSPGFTDLLSKILVPKFQDRISLNEIFEHPWFTKELPEAVKSRRYNLSPDFAAREAHLMALFKANEDKRAYSVLLSTLQALSQH